MENYQAVIRMQLIKSALFLVGVIVFVKCITTFVPEAVSVSSTINGRELPIYCVETQEKKVALSFDAAWGNEDTQKILDILARHNVHVTFFMTGGWVDSYPDDVKAILEAGIRKVVVGAGDPNPLVAGKGLEILRQHGVEVQEHVLEEECQEINQVFFHYICTGTPYVVMKYAMTLDGKIAAYTGASKWITGETARAHVQSLRHKYRGIMAGVGTVLADDPLLTCRMEGGRNPVRIICDTHLSTPLDSRILETAKEVDTILAIGQKVERERQIPYEEKGCTLLEIPEKEGKIDLSVLMKELGKRQIDSILLEGGGELNWSALQAGIVRKVMAYIAPKLIGGREAKGPVGGQGYPDPQESLFLKPGKISRLGDDYLIESEVDGNVHRNC